MDSISYELGTVLALLVVLVGLVLLTKSLARDYVSKYGGGARKHAQRKNSRTLLDTIDVREDVFFGVATDYALVKIPKRTGGSRQLQIPNAELKRLQRKLLLYLTLKVEFTVLFFDTFKRRRLSGWQYPCLPENTSAERCLTSPTTAI